MKRPKKGDHIQFVGGGSSGVKYGCGGYEPGTVVSYHTNRWHGPSVTVLLDNKHTDGTDLYADWPIAECESV